MGAVHQVNPDLPITDVATLGDYIDESLSQQRFSMSLLAAFATLAVVLTALGIYSVLSYAVKRRMREIAIRTAVGARRGDILGLIVADGLRPTLLGIAIGTVGALSLSRVLAALIYGVSTTDLLTFVAGALLLTLIGTAACIIPATRAMRVQPVQTLRDE